MPCSSSKDKVSCAGEGEPSVRAQSFPPVELPIRSPWWQQTRRSGCPRRERTRRCPHARRLRTGTPGTKPSILVIAGRILEALISVLLRRSLENLSLCCGHHRSKRRQSHHRHHRLTHCSLPVSFLKLNTTEELALTKFAFRKLNSLLMCAKTAKEFCCGDHGQRVPELIRQRGTFRCIGN